MAKKKDDKNQGVLASNRKAGHEYHLLEKLEAGLVLNGPEVKSARAGRVNLKESYIRLNKGEAWLIGAHFSPYEHARNDDYDPVRKRKLLLHSRELLKLERESTRGGMTVVPTKLYLKEGRIKLEIALAKGKKLHDKRDSIKERDQKREASRAAAARNADR